MSMQNNLNAIKEKSKNRDKDLRHMALIDIRTELSRSTDTNDQALTDFTEIVLALLNDNSSEVQGEAVKCLEPLVKKLSKQQIETSLTTLCSQIFGNEDEKRDIATLAVTTMVTKIPLDIGKDPIIQIVPKLLGGLSNASIQVKQHVLDVFTDVLSRFGATVSTKHDALKAAFLAELNSTSMPIRKRAIKCLSNLAPNLAEQLYDALVTSILDVFKAKSKQTVSTQELDKNLTYLQALFSISKTSGARLSKFASTITGILLKMHDIVSPTNIDDQGDEKMEESEEQAEEDEEKQVLKNEMRETIMSTFQSLILRTPNYLSPLEADAPSNTEKTNLEIMIIYCKENIEYDPNYEEEAEDEESMAAAEEAAGDEGAEDEDYTDDDDTTWKVRMAAVKCVNSIVITRPDLTGMIYREFCSQDDYLLPKRFTERTEQVKIEIFQTMHNLVQRTTQPENVKLLQNILEKVMKKMTVCLKTKSIKTKDAVFKLLTQITITLNGKTTTYLPFFMNSMIKILSEKIDQHTTLKCDVLQFIRVAFELHPPEKMVDTFKLVSQHVYGCTTDKYFKIVHESIRASTSFVPTIVLLQSKDKKIVETLFNCVFNCLKLQDIDQDVKEAAIEGIGLILAQLHNVLQPQSLSAALNILIERLNNEITRLVTCKTFGKIGKAKVPIPESVLKTVITEFGSFLKKVNRPLRQTSLDTLSIFTQSYSNLIKDSLFEEIIIEVSSLISDQDLHLAHQGLELVHEILKIKPQTASKIQENVFPKMVSLVCSPSLQGAALKSLLDVLEQMANKTDYIDLLRPLQKGFNQMGTVEAGTPSKEKEAISSSLSPQLFSNFGKTVAALINKAKEQKKDISKIISEFEAQMGSKKDFDVLVALYVLGEIGRKTDLSQTEIFKKVEDFFETGSEEKKNAASFALGNMALGAPSFFVPKIIQNIKKDNSRTYLLIHSLKQIMVRAENIQELCKYIDFNECVKVLLEYSHSEEEGIRHVVSETLGKMCTIRNQEIIPKIKNVLNLPATNENETNARDLSIATVINAVRYALNDRTSDVFGMKDLSQFLEKMNEKNLGIRKAALLLFNTVAANKKNLLVESKKEFTHLFDMVSNACTFEPNLVKTIQLGPFSTKLDEGLDSRKAAFETAATLLNSFGAELDATKFISICERGFGDQNPDIKTLCHMMIQKLCQKKIFITELSNNLKTILPECAKTLDKKPKENAVQQEKERHTELVKVVLKTVSLVNHILEENGTEKPIQLVELINNILKTKVLSDIFRKLDEEKDEE